MIGRTLRQTETAIDVLRLDAALERAKDELERRIREEMLRAVAAWVAGVAIAPAVRVTPEMVAVLDELRALGREEGRLELERLGYDLPARRFIADPAPHGRDVEGYLRRELPGIGIRIEDELVAADLAGASQAAIARALLRVPGARDIASRVISTALIDGLGQTFEEHADLVPCWEYTAVLDAATCGPCAEHDGQEFQSLEELFAVLPNFGPNPRCLGGGRCRCRAVPCPPDAAGAKLPRLVPPADSFDDQLGASLAAAEARAALEAVASVHSLPDPPAPIPLRLDPTLPPEIAGGYDPVRLEVVLNPAHVGDVGFTLVHELAHYIDDQAIGTPGTPASFVGTADLDDWRDAIVGTRAFRALVGIANDRRFDAIPSPSPQHSSFRAYVREYLLDPRELFARSYAQYVTGKTGAADLVRGLAESRALPYPEQWDDLDFGGVHAAFDRLLEALGWATTT